MTSLVDLVRSVVRHELGGLRSTSLAVVTDVHPHSADDDDHNDEVDVRLKHEDLTLPRVPVAVAHPGAVAPLKVGDLVLVSFLEGDLQQALVTASFHHADERPPLHPAGELVLEHRVAADGTVDQLRFAADGGFRLDRDVAADDSGARATVEVTADGDLVVRCGDDLQLVLSRGDGTVALTCSSLTVNGDVVVDGGDLTVKAGTATFSDGSTTTAVAGNSITGRQGGA